jgi:hypothetical protein
MCLIGGLGLVACRDVISLERAGEAESLPPAPQVEATVTVDAPALVEAGTLEPAVEPAPTFGRPAATPIPDPDLRNIDFGLVPSGGTVTVSLGPGDVSLLFYVRAEPAERYLVIDRIVEPSGAVLYDLNRASGVVSGEMFEHRLENNGAVAVYLPLAPQFDLVPGDYSFTFRTGDGDPPEEVGAIIRSGPVDEAQVLDLNFWILSSYLPFFTADSQNTIISQLRAEMDATLRPHNLQVGTINFIEASPAAKESLAELAGLPLAGRLSQLCLAMAAEVGQARALRVVLLDDFGRPVAGTGPAALLTAGQIVPLPADTETLPVPSQGATTGQPGPVLVDHSAQSCVAIAVGQDYDFRQNRQGLNILRQASRLMGLAYTTAPEGVTFDRLADTPECQRESFDRNGDDLVEAGECAEADAGNYLFWAEGGTTMTAAQAWTLRRHPLWRPLTP